MIGFKVLIDLMKHLKNQKRTVNQAQIEYKMNYASILIK